MKNTYLELPSHSPASRTIALTTVAMVAFAANSRAVQVGLHKCID